MNREAYLAFFEQFAHDNFQLTKRKGEDYAHGDDPFRNFRQVEQLGVCTTEQGIVTRMTDKLSRLASFCQRGELSVKDESVTDTLRDVAIYATILAAYLESKKVDKEKRWVSAQAEYNAAMCGVVGTIQPADPRLTTACIDDSSIRATRVKCP